MSMADLRVDSSVNIKPQAPQEAPIQTTEKSENPNIWTDKNGTTHFFYPGDGNYIEPGSGDVREDDGSINMRGRYEKDIESGETEDIEEANNENDKNLNEIGKKQKQIWKGNGNKEDFTSVTGSSIRTWTSGAWIGDFNPYTEELSKDELKEIDDWKSPIKINTPNTQNSTFVTGPTSPPRFEDTVPTTIPENPFKNITDPAPGEFVSGSDDGFVVKTEDNNLLKQHNQNITLNNKDAKYEFVNSERGVIRRPITKDGKIIEEISIERPMLNDNELPSKLEIKPKYYVDKESVTYKKDESGKSTGEIEETKYFWPTVALNADTGEDGDNTRFGPFSDSNDVGVSANEDGTAVNGMLNFDEKELLHTTKKSIYHSKINTKYNVLFKGTGQEVNTETLDFGLGNLFVMKNTTAATSSTDDCYYNIPFQFNAEISGESRSSNWNSHTALGRTNEYFIWANTTSRTMSFRTSYAIIAPDTNDPVWFKDKPNLASAAAKSNNASINPIFEEWGTYWTETNINGILNKYRKLLVPPDFSGEKTPPIVVIHFGRAHETKYSDSPSDGRSRWIVTDVNIDTRIEAGWTQNKNPRMYDISCTLKEAAPGWRSYQTMAEF
jgi:hypothetical protein